MIAISARQQFILDSIKHEDMLKAKREDYRKHLEKRQRDLAEETKTRENRAMVMIEHEENNKANSLVREQEVEKHQEFLKNSLRII